MSRSVTRVLFTNFCLAAATLVAAQSAQAATAEKPGVHNVVLVHGAWGDGTNWAKVIPLLEARGLHVVAVQNPLTSYADDVAATKRAIALLDAPVLLVGHSYGGAVITEAGNDPKVTGLVYVAAFAPHDGEAAGDMGKAFPVPPGLAELRPDAAGFLSQTPKGINENFAPDLSPAERDVMLATQHPTSVTALGGKVTTAAWKTKPSWYVVASNDRMINPDFQKSMAAELKAKTISLASSHVVMMSHPTEVAAFIVKAAMAAPAH